jgi:hypothetical protein
MGDPVMPSTRMQIKPPDFIQRSVAEIVYFTWSSHPKKYGRRKRSNERDDILKYVAEESLKKQANLPLSYYRLEDKYISFYQKYFHKCFDLLTLKHPLAHPSFLQPF